MRVLVVGAGGREHALAWKIARSPRVERVLAAPGSGGMAREAACFPSLAAGDAPGLVKLARIEGVDLVVVGPEEPLANGLGDRLREAGLAVFGPSAAAARLEGSKAFAREFMARHRIPHPRFDVCNALLDIQYGGFAVEVLLWTVAFALTLRVGWRQGGEVTEAGTRWMRRTLFLGVLLTVVIFIPMWGFPRAGVYLLAMLMVSYNCVTATRRHLHLGLLVSLILVMFAATHFRADWTMLFYLVPYVAAVVFTLVAEQINRKPGELRQQSLGHQIVGAQGTAIAAATVAILALGLLLYALTPQLTWMSMSWRWGQPSGASLGNEDSQAGNSGFGSGKSASGSGTELPDQGVAGDCQRSSRALKGPPPG